MELRSYQRSGAAFLLDVRRAILADEMGVGKTPQLIRAARGDTLVVAPPGLHANWSREIASWATGDALFQVTSYHSLTDPKIKTGGRTPHVLGVPRKQFKGPWDTVIFDEAHHLKGRNTGYAKAGVTISAASERVYLATGTPIRNWAHEVFMLCRALYPKDERFSSFWRWVDRWFTVTEEVTYFNRKRQKHQVIGDLRDITDWETFYRRNGLTERMIRRTLEDPEVDIELPDLDIIKVYTSMGPTQRKAYRSMEKQFFVAAEGSKFIATTTGSQWSHLMRLSSGLLFHPDILSGPSSKLDALEDLLEDLGDEQLIIFCWFRETVEALANWLAHKTGAGTFYCHGGMSQTLQDGQRRGFADKKAPFLVGTYGVLSEGHNFVGCRKMVLFEHPAVPALEDQAVKRIHRFGQTEKCTVWSLVTDDTVDSYYVDKVLPNKRAHASGMDAVITQADLRKYLGR